MLADLEGILEISKADNEIYQLNQRKKDLPADIEKITRWMAGEKEAAEALEARAQALEKESRSLESDITDIKEKKQKSDERLTQITTNAEYDAVHTELETHRRNLLKAEERVLEIMGELEQLTATRAAAQEKLSGSDVKEKEVELARLQAELANIESEIAAKQAVRNTAAGKLSPRINKLYEKLNKARSNGRCVGVVTDSRRVCGTCAIRLTPQKFINVKKSDTLQTCESCGGILVWQKD